MKPKMLPSLAQSHLSATGTTLGLRALSLLLLVTFTPSALAQEPARIVLFHVNDVHGYLEGVTRTPGHISGGASALQNVLSERKSEAVRARSRWLFVSAGDIFRGTPLVDDTDGKAAIDVFNHLRLTASCLGNHDFDYGPDALLARCHEARFLVLRTNVFPSSDEPISGVQRASFRVGDVVVGLLGVTTPDAMLSNTPALMKPFLITPPAGPVEANASRLRKEGASLVVVLSHLGLASDIALATECPDLDVIIGGHSHELLQEPLTVGRTIIVQAGANLSHVGELLLQKVNGSDRWTAAGYHLWPLADVSTASSSGANQVIEQYSGPIRVRLDSVIASLTTPITKAAPANSCPVTALVAEAMRQSTKSNVALFYGRGTRCGLPAGPVAVRTVRELVPFGNTLVTMQLTGAALLKVLEEGVRGSWRPCEPGTKPSSGSRVSPPPVRPTWEPTSQASRVLQCAGLSYAFDPRLPEGKRVVKAAVDGHDLISQRIYTVVTNSFLAGGGDGYTAFFAGRNVIWRGEKDYDVVVDFVRRGGLALLPATPAFVNLANEP